MEQQKFKLELSHYLIGTQLATKCKDMISHNGIFDGSYLVTAAYMMLLFTKKMMMGKGAAEEDIDKLFSEIKQQIKDAIKDTQIPD